MCPKCGSDKVVVEFYRDNGDENEDASEELRMTCCCGYYWVEQTLDAAPAQQPDADASSLRERLAALEHEQWAHWTRHMMSNSTSENLARWADQARTPYAQLTESDKDKDREWADKVLCEIRPDADTLRKLWRVATAAGWYLHDSAPMGCDAEAELQKNLDALHETPPDDALKAAYRGRTAEDVAAALRLADAVRGMPKGAKLERLERNGEWWYYLPVDGYRGREGYSSPAEALGLDGDATDVHFKMKNGG
jgi:hypothetical protein